MLCIYIVLAYRIPGNLMMSTFVHSASHVAGDTALTDPAAPIGKGIGTKAYVLNTLVGSVLVPWGC